MTDDPLEPTEPRSETSRLVDRLIAAGVKPGADLLKLAERAVTPAWRQVSDPESRWAASAAVAAAMALQLSLPLDYTIRPTWAIVAIEALLLVGLLIPKDLRRGTESGTIRRLSIVLVAVLTVTNGWSAVKLIRNLVLGLHTIKPVPLLATGGAIWLTNMIAFALWYWEFDSGGPTARYKGEVQYPDFLFPQMQEPKVAPEDWKPTFVDYLYTSFTNGAAFSPTDVLPLTPRAKLTMMVQSIVSLVTVALVVARAVNILK